MDTLLAFFHRYSWQQRNYDSPFISMYLIEVCSVKSLDFLCQFPILPSPNFFTALCCTYLMVLISLSFPFSPNLCPVNSSSDNPEITSELQLFQRPISKPNLDTTNTIRANLVFFLALQLVLAEIFLSHFNYAELWNLI